jgi:hypothetical protein
VLACAWIVAFFPVLANTTLGLNSVDHNLADLFRMYGASRRQVLLELKLPAALPQMLAGIKIAGGLSLIGAVVAEIAAGSAGAGSGLRSASPSRAIGSTSRGCSRRCCLLSIAGIAIFALLSALTHSGAAPLARKRDHPRSLNGGDRSGRELHRFRDPHRDDPGDRERREIRSQKDRQADGVAPDRGCAHADEVVEYVTDNHQDDIDQKDPHGRLRLCRRSRHTIDIWLRPTAIRRRRREASEAIKFL